MSRKPIVLGVFLILLITIISPVTSICKKTSKSNDFNGNGWEYDEDTGTWSIELPAFRENIDEFIKTKFQNTTNCDCEYTTVRRFPILCQILLPIALLYYYLITVYYDYDPPRIILQQYAMFKAMAESWSCWWIWWETIN